MIHDVKEFFGLEREFKNAGFFETANYKMFFQDVVSVAKEGHIIAITGVVGSGKTITARRIRNDLKERKEVLVSTNFAVDKNRVNLGTLMYALFADLMDDKNEKIPSKLEFRERQLQSLVKRKKKPVALFIDEAHDLHHKTLVGLKRLQEIVLEADSLLSIVLVGHPKLKNDLNRPAMEEIGGRITILQMEGIQGFEIEYIKWLLRQCLNKKTKSTDVFTEDAMEFMAEKFSTPLQINHYAWNALVKAYQIGQKPVELETLQEIISVDLNSIEANLKRYGYDIKAVGEAVDAKPSEIKAFFKKRLASSRAREIHDEILKLGIAGS
jgi:type II secretory pathway predicted ATPase ExeA